MKAESAKSILSRTQKNLELLQKRLEDNEFSERSSNEPVAIVGIGCRYPGGVRDPDSFWDVISKGIDTITDIPPNRFNVEDLYSETPGKVGKISHRQGGYLEDIDKFDAAFFGISPREARLMDPQQRLLLETAWESLEDAGLPLARVSGTKTGVFLGIWSGDYEFHMTNDIEDLDLHVTTGGGRYVGAGRLSHFFDFRGPSLSLDTACSSSLVAVHLACQSLRQKESTMALACAVNLILDPYISVAYSRVEMLSPFARCRFGDKKAGGYVRSEGVAVLTLKLLSDARANNDPIYAIIRGSAVTNEGHTEDLMVHPGVEGQKIMLDAAYKSAGISPADVQYVECHGTGTRVGDPVELTALGKTMGKNRDTPLLVGSIKTNFGHTEAAAGMAGLIKTALSLKYKKIPPSLHFETPNPNIPWEEFSIKVQTELSDWPERSRPAIAGVSAFGISATNAHIILEEAPANSSAPTLPGKSALTQNSPAPEENSFRLLTISAHTREALRDRSLAWAKLLEDDSSIDYLNLIHTANLRRSHLTHRLSSVGADIKEHSENLKAFARGEDLGPDKQNRVYSGEISGSVFVASGQGPAFWPLTPELTLQFPIFLKILNQCDQILKGYAGWSLLEELTRPSNNSRLNRTEFTQPALCAIQIALFELWKSLGVKPEVVIGHSMGEVPAAYMAGALSLEDTLLVIYHRGRLIQRLCGQGKMAFVELAQDELKEWLVPFENKLSIGAINSPKNTVISGDAREIENLVIKLKNENIFCKILESVDFASHSPQMESIQDELNGALTDVKPRACDIKFLSTVTSEFLSGDKLDNAYWSNNIRETVIFGPSIEFLYNNGYRTFLEIAPHPALAGSITRCLSKYGEDEDERALILYSLEKGRSQTKSFLNAAGALYTKGHPVDFHALHPDKGTLTRLPPFPWQRETYWYEKKNGTKRPQTRSQKETPVISRTVQAAENAGLPPKETIHYNIFWEEKIRERNKSGNGEQNEYLIFANRHGPGEELKSILEKNHANVRLVYPSEPENETKDEIIFTGQDIIHISPDQQSHYEALLKKFPDTNKIIYLWGLEYNREQELSLKTLQESEGPGGAFALLLLKAIFTAQGNDIPRLWLVSQGARSLEITGEDKGDSSARHKGFLGAPLWGLGRSVHMEHPRIYCGVLDLEPGENVDEAARILAEECESFETENQIAFRRGKRYVPRLKPTVAPKGTISFKRDATYIITGGLGELGLETARWAVARGAKNIVLTARNTLPPRATWDTIDKDDPRFKKIQAVRDISSLGARIAVIKADVSDPVRMGQIFDQMKQKLPPIKGIFHAAGFVEEREINDMSSSEFLDLLAPKTRGTLILHEATRESKLDFFVMFSSTAAVFGAAFAAHYSAANNFLDSFADYRIRNNLPALSINWGPWEKLGLGAEKTRSNMERSGYRNISASQAIGSLEGLLARKQGRQIISAFEWTTFKSVYEAKARNQFLEHIITEENTPRPLIPEGRPPSSNGHSPFLKKFSLTPGSKQRVLLINHVRSQVGKVLGLNPSQQMEKRQGFFQSGMDSTMAIELVRLLSHDVGIDLKSTIAFDYPNIEALSDHLLLQVVNFKKVDTPSPPPRVETREREITTRLPATGVDREQIAVIGMSCRFPGENDSPESLWQFLLNAQDGIGKIPADRWDNESYYNPDPNVIGTINTRYGGFLNQISLFDADFFNVSPREAVSMDPQQRIVLEVSWEALESAGIPADSLKGSSTGVFMGVTSTDYFHLQQKVDNPEMIDNYTGTGGSIYSVAGRVSYTFGLQGPSMSIDTACASSLVSVHQACRSLLDDEADLALAGGVNLILVPDTYIFLSRAGGLAKDGRCKTFDDSADGMSRSEGCGVVVLKRLSDALKDGDNILAVIRGSAVAQDGASGGFTVPSGPAQVKLIRKALKAADVSPADISYVEAHGTGTALGDPIEFNALAEVMGEGRNTTYPLYLGSIKSNIGHAEAAAGIAGLIKTVLALKNKQIPPNIHFNKPNSKIQFESIPARVPTRSLFWDANDRKRLAGVSAFGISGTLAHIVLEEAPPHEINEDNENSPRNILVISAQNETSLKKLAASYLDLIQKKRISLTNLSYTAALKRVHHEHRVAAVYDTQEELEEHLTAFAKNDSPEYVFYGKSLEEPPPLVFIFSGYGSYWAEMANDLINEEPVFLESVQACDRAISPLVEWSLLDELLAPEDETRNDNLVIIQALIFTMQVSLAALWRSYGIVPDIVVGHSMGEVSAAHYAGALTLEEAALVLIRRSEVAMQARGAMLSVDLGLKQCDRILAGREDKLSIASSNGPESTVISGDSESIKELAETLKKEKIESRLVKVSVAGHSPLMDPFLDDFKDTIKNINPGNNNITFYSSVTTDVLEGENLDPGYWARNLRETVQFWPTLQKLHKAENYYLEISPHPVLLSPLRQGVGAESILLPGLRRQEKSTKVILNSLARLYVDGFSVNWKNIYTSGAAIPIPFYPWNKESYWLTGVEREERGSSVTPLLGRMINVARNKTRIWEKDIRSEKFPWLKDYRILDNLILPSSTYIEMGIRAFQEVHGNINKNEAIQIKKLRFKSSLFFAGDQKQSLQFSLEPKKEENFIFNIYSQESSSENWTLHCEGEIGEIKKVPPPIRDIKNLSKTLTEEIKAREFYEKLAEIGVMLGPSFQTNTSIYRLYGRSFREITPNEGVDKDNHRYIFHPAFLDICFQTLLASFPYELSSMEQENGQFHVKDAYVLKSVDELVIYSLEKKTRLFAYCSFISLSQDEKEIRQNPRQMNIELLDEKGNVVLEARGLEIEYIGNNPEYMSKNMEDWFYEPRWEITKRDINEITPISNLPEKWIIFSDREGIGEKLGEALRKEGMECHLVFSDEIYGFIANEQFRINPGRLADFKRLFSELKLEEIEPPAQKGDKKNVGLVHLWSLDTSPTKFLDTTGLDDAALLTCGSLLNFLKQPRKLISQFQLWLVTAGARKITGQEELNLAQSPLWGIGGTIAEEYADQWGGLIDLDPLDSPHTAAQALKNELILPDGEKQVGFRNNARYGLRLVPRKNNPQNGVSRSISSNLIEPQASYLVTGGIGALGLVTARWLAQQGATHLILMGRSGFPPQDSWSGLSQDLNMDWKIRMLQKIESMGAEIEIVSADVSNENQIINTFNSLKEKKWPPLKGIMHAAGISYLRPIEELSVSDLKSDFRAKVHGSWTLHNLIEKNNIDLDFFVFFSSAASLLNSPLLGTYSAANAFMDALAHYRRSKNLPSLSVNWGYWSEVGLAARAYAHKDDDSYNKGMGSFTPAQGTRVLEHLMQTNALQTGVIPANWKQWAHYHPHSAATPFFKHLLGGQKEKKTDQLSETIPDLEVLKVLPPELRQEIMETYLSEQLGLVLRIPASRLKRERPFSKLGFDSMMAVELKRKLSSHLDLDVPLLSLLSASGISRYATQLLAQLFQELYPEGSVEEKKDKQSPTREGVWLEQLVFTSKDDMKIYGHLSLPEGQGPFPAVVVHTAYQGGALNSDGDYESIYEHHPLCSAGFAVFTVDQRGAQGHGHAYVKSFDLGGGDVDDLIAAAEYLSTLNQIDPTAITIMGTSRGAFAALLAMSRTPHIWKGGILNMGCYDLISLIRDQETGRSIDGGLMLLLELGRKDMYEYFIQENRIPILNVKNVKAPLFVIHGEKDDMVLIDQALALQNVAQRHGVELTLESVAHMGHDIRFADPVWQDLWKKIADFLRDSIKR